ncbi:hypothetical protein Pcinc_018326 [Petrolisthes cinctipes]|uniref:Uncharacterized protein n=1 Tax=Petrolisthes cinctipes TaxID=88211 RepID=A0AAE1KML5_PETCI|nr:hypothetical protein Pcinc_018326 [Petrolisthes cinctipes]
MYQCIRVLQVDAGLYHYVSLHLCIRVLQVDAGLRPWLLEVNRSPSLSHDCHVDRVVKKPLLHHLFDLVGPPRVPEPPLGRPLRPPVLFLLARRPRRHLCAALRLLGGRGGGGGGGTGGCQGSGCRGECQGRTGYQKHTNTTILPPTTANRHVTRQLSISSYDSSTSSTASSNGRKRVGWGVGGGVGGRGMEAGKLGWGRTGRNSIEGSSGGGGSSSSSSSVGRRRSQRNSDGGGRLSWGSGGSSSSSSSNGSSGSSGTGGGGRRGGRWPARCGGWVRTFPFNAATLHASRDPSFLKTQVSELLRYQRACDRAARDNPTNASQATLDAAVRKLLWRDTVIWAPAYPP